LGAATAFSAAAGLGGSTEGGGRVARGSMRGLNSTFRGDLGREDGPAAGSDSANSVTRGGGAGDVTSAAVVESVVESVVERGAEVWSAGARDLAACGIDAATPVARYITARPVTTPRGSQVAPLRNGDVLAGAPTPANDDDWPFGAGSNACGPGARKLSVR
jgi:hypothetical protein